MAANVKLNRVMFQGPVWIDGLGTVDRLDISPDVDTGRPKLPGVSITWLAEERLLRVSTHAGETLLCVPWSGKPVYEDRASAALKSKTAK